MLNPLIQRRAGQLIALGRITVSEQQAPKADPNLNRICDTKVPDHLSFLKVPARAIAHSGAECPDQLAFTIAQPRKA